MNCSLYKLLLLLLYKLFNCYTNEDFHFCIYLFVVNEIWNGENHYSSVTEDGMKQNEWNLESQVIIKVSYILLYICDLFLCIILWFCISYKQMESNLMCLFNMLPLQQAAEIWRE